MQSQSGLDKRKNRQESAIKFKFKDTKSLIGHSRSGQSVKKKEKKKKKRVECCPKLPSVQIPIPFHVDRCRDSRLVGGLLGVKIFLVAGIEDIILLIGEEAGVGADLF